MAVYPIRSSIPTRYQTSLTMQHRILVVEDERDIAALVQLHLDDIATDICLVHDGLLAREKALAEHWDLLLLDLRLPGMGGLDLCRDLRSAGSTTPVMMLTARGSELDRVLGLEMGADDYLTKPFSVLELQARVKALLRRSVMREQPSATSSTLQQGDIYLDRGQRRAIRGGQQLELTAKEFDLLLFFVSHPGTVFSRTELLDQVWGYGHDGYEHTVNSHINRLRAKLEAEGPGYIHTVWGVGYRFETHV
jgi:two-component system OmpR family response regulator